MTRFPADYDAVLPISQMSSSTRGLEDVLGLVPHSVFYDLAHAGFLPDLIPILPPGARLSETSNISPGSCGKTPGVLKPDGTWIGYRGWPSHLATWDDVALWSTWPNAGVGIIGRRVIGIDGDVTDPALADRIEETALRVLGPAIRRIGRAPKFLLPYRVGEPLSAAAVTLSAGGEKHVVEIRAAGQQWVASGTHPGTLKPYQYDRGNLASVGFDGLTPVTLEMVNTFLEAVASIGEACGYSVKSVRAASLVKSAVTTATSITAATHWPSDDERWHCPRPGRQAPAGFVANLPCHFARVVSYLEGQQPAIEGAGGDPLTLQVARRCMDLGLTPPAVIEAMLQHWNERCLPPWEPDELRQKVFNAWNYQRDNAIGCDATAPASEVFAGDRESAAPAATEVTTESEPLDMFDDAWSSGEPLPFPSEALPKVIEDFAHDEAARKGVDLGVVAIPALVACASAIHAELVIQPTNDTTWQQRPVLWGMLVGGPSSVKTPVLTAVTKPLEEIQAKWFEDDKALFAQRKQLHDEWEAQRAKKLRTIRDAGLDIARSSAGIDLGPEPALPALRRLLVKDATVEGLAVVLANNSQRGVLMYRNELAGWITSFDNYRENGKGHDKTHYLEGWDSAPQLIDRVSKKDGPTYIKHWSISVLGGIQPHRLKPWAKQLSADGLLQRFWVVPAGLPREREDRPPGAANGAYSELIGRLTELRPEYRHDGSVAPVQLSKEARQQWVRVDRFCRDEMTLNAGHEAYCEHLGKWGSQFARLLLVFHAIESVTAFSAPKSAAGLPLEVSGETAERAARLAIKYLIPSAERFYKDVFNAGPEWDHALWIASFILTRGPDRKTICPRDVYMNNHGLMGKERAKDLQEAMLILEHRGWVTPTKTVPMRGVTEWAINPLVHVRFAKWAASEAKRKSAIKSQIEAAAGRRRAEELG